MINSAKLLCLALLGITQVSANFSCVMNVQNCQKKTQRLEWYKRAMSDKELVSTYKKWKASLEDWKLEQHHENMHKNFLGDGEYAADTNDIDKPIWVGNPDSNLIFTPTYDDDDSDGDGGSDDSDGDGADDGIDFVTPFKVTNGKCDVYIDRLLHEGKGVVEGKGQIYDDSFSIRYGWKVCPRRIKAYYWSTLTDINAEAGLFNGLKPATSDIHLNPNQKNVPMWATGHAYLNAQKDGKLITDMFVRKEFGAEKINDNSGNKITLKMNHRGEQQYVTLDNRLPVFSSDKRDVVMCKPSNKDGNYWCSFLEKAYAKAVSQYWQMQYTSPLVSMKFLNNAPVSYYPAYSTNLDEFKARVTASSANGDAQVLRMSRRYRGGKFQAGAYVAVKSVSPNGNVVVTDPRQPGKDIQMSFQELKAATYYVYNQYTGDEWKIVTRNITLERADDALDGQYIHFENPKDGQKVCVALLGASYHQLYNWGRCTDSNYKLDSIAWGIASDDQFVVSNNKYNKVWLSSSSGGGMLCFDNLPKGYYDLKQSNSRFSSKNTKDMNFSMVTYCADEECPIASSHD